MANTSDILISLTHEAIDGESLLDSVASDLAGANVLFTGTARKLTGGLETMFLEYDAHPEMAEQKLAEVAGTAREKWNLCGVAITHRLGRVEIGEVSIAVAISSPHRLAAIEAIEWIMDTVKRSVPIWKKEHWADGSTEWIHHGQKPCAVEEWNHE